MMNPRDFAVNLIRSNPQIAGNKNARELLEVIQSGDRQRGEQIAQNLCNTYGISMDQALSEAKSFFHIPQ